VPFPHGLLLPRNSAGVDPLQAQEMLWQSGGVKPMSPAPVNVLPLGSTCPWNGTPHCCRKFSSMKMMSVKAPVVESMVPWLRPVGSSGT